MSDEVEIQFPVEFPVMGTPVSVQSKLPKSKDRWKDTVRSSSYSAVAGDKFLSQDRLAVTIYDFPTDEPQGDVDNIVKLIIDALNSRIWTDDHQVRRVVAQRFLPAEIEELDPIPELVARALIHDPPFVYIHISSRPLEYTQ